MDTENYTEAEERQIVLWNLVKEVTGSRPRYYTAQEWANPEFVENKIAQYSELLKSMV